MGRLLKRLLEMGTSPGIARGMIERVVNVKRVVDVQEELGINMEMLDLVRSSVRSRWVEHFHFGARAGLVLGGGGGGGGGLGGTGGGGTGGGLPVTGFTFMVSFILIGVIFLLFIYLFIL
ncbi:hypothetical protein GGU11DRAFT_538932 [Lentinula aff. detonsa]|nr:hypothetical protein GGU11DRAFT_538932 [Lentinula aff. detonsa]